VPRLQPEAPARADRRTHTLARSTRESGDVVYEMHLVRIAEKWYNVCETQ